MRFPSSLPCSLPCACLLLVSLSGCDSNGDIKVQRVPKDTDVAKAPAADPHAGVPMPIPGGTDPHAGIPMPVPGGADPHAGLAMPGAPGAARPPAVSGEVPETWKAGRGSSMRLASYLAEGENEAVADISLIVLGGGAGGVLDNVNRWRTQIGLTPVDAPGLAENSQKLTTPQGEATVVDLTSEKAVPEPTRDGRIVAAIIPLANEMWFYKMRGNAELVGREKEGFLRWVETARKAEPSPVSKPPAQTPAQTPAPTPSIPETAPPATSPREILWKVPEAWKETPGKSMRVATFALGGADGATGEVSVFKLGGAAGGDLANVNRWRGQIGLGPITAEELAAAVTSVDSPAGAITQIDCPGAEKRTLAAWLPRDSNTWFFKLNGPTGLVEAEQARFTSFLSSIEFPAK